MMRCRTTCAAMNETADALARQAAQLVDGGDVVLVKGNQGSNQPCCR
jgi:hypothetical protein